MSKHRLEDLYERFCSTGDIDALAQVFDLLAPGLARVAQRLSRDPNSADDLVQETFLTAIERSATFDARRPLLPWLLGILTQRAREAARREKWSLPGDALGPAPLAAPEDGLAQHETQTLVAKAMDELPSGDRELLNARWFEGREIAELARELEISTGTLRVRMHRALGRLRTILPAALGSWLAVALLGSRGLSQAREAVLRAGTRHAAAKGLAVGAVGTGKGLLVCAVLLLMGGPLAWWALSLLRQPGDQQLVGLVSPDSASAPSARERVDDSSQRSVQETTPQAQLTAPEAQLRVLVTESASAAPAPDQSVVLTLWGSAPAIHKQTNEQGLAVFAIQPGQRTKFVVVEATPSTTWQQQWCQATLAAGDVKEIAFKLVTGWPVSGRVVDLQGRPQVGVDVVGWSGDRAPDPPQRSTKSGPNGIYRLEHLGPDFVLAARGESMTSMMGFRGQLSDDVTAEGLELVVAPAGTLRGRVLTPEGVPVVGARLRRSGGLMTHGPDDATNISGVLKFWGLELETESDADGRFEFGGLQHGRATISAQQAPYLSTPGQGQVNGDPIDIVLDPGYSLRGRVLDARGMPAVGAAVRVSPWGSGTPATCDSFGEFLIPFLRREESYVLVANYPGHAVLAKHGVNAHEMGGEPTLFELQPGQVIAGRVVDGDGQPVAGARVWVGGDRLLEVGVRMERPTTWEWGAGLDTLTTDQDGSFSFTQLYPGTFGVHVRAPGDQRTEVHATTTSGSSTILEVELSAATLRKVALHGAVTDAHTGEPITSYSLVTSRQDSNGAIAEFARADGRFEISGLDPGEIQIDVRAPGYAISRMSSRRFELGEHELNLRLVPARSLEVNVIDQNGAHIASGLVTVSTAAGLEVSLKKGPGMWGGGIELSARASYLHGLPAGPLVLRVTVHDQVREFPVDVSLPRRAPLELVFEVASAVEPSTWPVTLVLLVASGSVGEQELQTELAFLGQPRFADWLNGHLAHGTITLVEQNLELTVRSRGGALIGTASLRFAAQGASTITYSPGMAKVNKGIVEALLVQGSAGSQPVSTPPISNLGTPRFPLNREFFSRPYQVGEPILFRASARDLVLQWKSESYEQGETGIPASDQAASPQIIFLRER